MTALADAGPPPSPTAVGVVVPARDEQQRIGACLASIRRALATVPAHVDVAVAVVLDRCADATPPGSPNSSSGGRRRGRSR